MTRLMLLWFIASFIGLGSIRAQESVTPLYATGTPSRSTNVVSLKQDSFTFVRIRYSQTRPPMRSWQTDYPDAELNLSRHVQKTTGLNCDPAGKVLDLSDSTLTNYPFIYIAEGGQMKLGDSEKRGLKAYLESGGFLMVDDFWGEAEWKQVEEEVVGLLPSFKVVDLPLTHPLFHSFYEMKEKPQVPNVALGVLSEKTGVTWERADAKQAHYRGMFNDKGEMVALFCHNTDLADGWEREAEHQYYTREFTYKRAYPMGVNIVVYALSR